LRRVCRKDRSHLSRFACFWANGKERPLGIPTMKDRAMPALHLLSLEPVVESQSDPNSDGFRINRSTADAMRQLFILLSRKASAEWVREADIEGCCDHINPRKLGGSNGITNRVLLHPVRHHQLHALGASVAKPASGRGFGAN
jgi:hypothetical protein